MERQAADLDLQIHFGSPGQQIHLAVVELATEPTATVEPSFELGIAVQPFVLDHIELEAVQLLVDVQEAMPVVADSTDC